MDLIVILDPDLEPHENLCGSETLKKIWSGGSRKRMRRGQPERHDWRAEVPVLGAGGIHVEAAGLTGSPSILTFGSTHS